MRERRGEERRGEEEGEEARRRRRERDEVPAWAERRKEEKKISVLRKVRREEGEREIRQKSIFFIRDLQGRDGGGTEIHIIRGNHGEGERDGRVKKEMRERAVLLMDVRDGRCEGEVKSRRRPPSRSRCRSNGRRKPPDNSHARPGDEVLAAGGGFRW